MTRPRFATAVRAIQVPAALIVLVAVGGGLASIGPNSLDRYVTISAVNLVFAIGVYVYIGTTGVISFGHFGFATLGAYVGGLLSMGTRLKSATLPNLPRFIADTQLDPLLAIVAGGCAAAFVALLLAPAIGRISGLAASLATLSLLFIARSVAANLTTFTRGTAGLSSVPRWTTLTNTLVVASIFIVAVYAYQRSTSGLRLRSSKSDLVAARAIGVNVGVERSIAWVLSAFIVGCGGAMFVMLLGSIGPETLFINQTFLVVAMVVVGGAGSLSGTVVGVLVVSTISEVLTRAEDSGSLLGLVPVPQRPGIRNVVVAVLLIAMLTLRPAGLTGGREVRPLDRVAVLRAHRRRGTGKIGRASQEREGDLRR